MAKFDFIAETTPSGESVMVANFTAELVSVAEKAISNSNGNDYHPCTIKFLNAEDKQQTATGLMYAGNYKNGVTVGNSYLAKVIMQTGKNPLIVVSHLDRASSVTADAFGFTVEAVAEFDSVAKK